MTGPIIPAGEWPEKAVMHSWDRSVDGIDGEGYWTSYDEQLGAWTTQRSGLLMPPGHDWRVPVMRQAAPAIDLEQFRSALVSLSDYAYERHGNMDHPHCLEADRLLALIDGQEDYSFPCCGGNDETPREHCMDCPDFPGQPGKGEGE